jgi:hypothetical protein
MIRVVWEHSLDGLKKLGTGIMSWLLGASSGEYGSKKSEPDTALGQFPAGDLRERGKQLSEQRKGGVQRSAAPARRIR